MKTIEEQIFDKVQNIPDKVALISGHLQKRVDSIAQ